MILAHLTSFAIFLVLLWAIAFLGFHVLGWAIHLLLVVAIIAFLVRIIQGKNPLK